MDSLDLKRVSVRLWRSLLKPWFLLVGAFLVSIFTCAVLLSNPTTTRTSHRLSLNQQPPGGKLPGSSGSVAMTIGDGRQKGYDDHYAAFLKRPVIYPHNYTYLINEPSACLDQAVHLVITTPSAPDNFFRRMMMRKSLSKHSVIRQLFFIGSTNDTGIQSKILAESTRFKDIIQEDHVDVYANITLKAVQMLRWVSETCPYSKYVIRLDDDVSADVSKMLAAMTRARETHPEFVMGNVKIGWRPCRIPKCFTTKSEYPHATLPPFALGGALGYPTSSVKRLYEASKRIKRFKLDDVYVTGMCAPLVNVTLLKDAEFEAFKHGAW